MDEFDEAKYNWHKSQEAWHGKLPGKWHKSQWRWHRAVIRKLPGLLGFIVGSALRKHAGRIAENVSLNNALWTRMKAAR